MDKGSELSMQEDLIKIFVESTNHKKISRLPCISSGVAQVKAGLVWRVVFVYRDKLNSAKLTISKSVGSGEQIFTIYTSGNERIWLHPDRVYIDGEELYNVDMFLDPAFPTTDEIKMLRMVKGASLEKVMQGIGKEPGDIIHAILSGSFVEEYKTTNNERVIVINPP